MNNHQKQQTLETKKCSECGGSGEKLRRATAVDFGDRQYSFYVCTECFSHGLIVYQQGAAGWEDAEKIHESVSIQEARE